MKILERSTYVRTELSASPAFLAARSKRSSSLYRSVILQVDSIRPSSSTRRRTHYFGRRVRGSWRRQTALNSLDTAAWTSSSMISSFCLSHFRPGYGIPSPRARSLTGAWLSAKRKTSRSLHPPRSPDVDRRPRTGPQSRPPEPQPTSQYPCPRDHSGSRTSKHVRVRRGARLRLVVARRLDDAVLS
jgi:hypothetical protein